MASKKPRRRLQSKHSAGEFEWRDAVEYALQGMLDRWDLRQLTPPTARVLSVSTRGNAVQFEMRFHSGGRYCCYEAPCGLKAWSHTWWRLFREMLAEVSDRMPPPFRLKVEVVVEAGSKIEGYKPVGWITAKKGYAYTVTFDERDAWTP